MDYNLTVRETILHKIKVFDMTKEEAMKKALNIADENMSDGFERKLELVAVIPDEKTKV
jgi:hypothetical protein